MTNSELIKALKACSENCACDKCPYGMEDDCPSTESMMRDAADALEAADKRIADLQQTCNKLASNLQQAQMPKEGEWGERYIEDANPMFRRRFYCSRCGEWTTHGKTRYCPNCGARMRGEQK